MSTLDRIKELVAKQAEVSVDMNEATAGGSSKLIPSGRYIGVVCEYTDLGTHKEMYKGQAKDPCPQFRIGVALYGENVQAEDGTPYVLRSLDLSVKRNEKANTYKMFQAMNYKNDPKIKHFAQFIGQAFIFQVEVNKSQKSGREYSTIVWDKTAPAIDVVSGKPYPVPEVPEEFYKVFLWDFPTKEDWDALHIEGTNDDGTSRNFIQDKIVSALDFQGSALQELLDASGEPPAAVQATEGTNLEVSAPVAPQAPVAAPVAPVSPVVPAAPVTPEV